MLFVSVYGYVTLRTRGIAGLQHAIGVGASSDVAGFRTVAEARKVDDIGLHVGGLTSIAKARCMAAAEFLRAPADCDVWIQCDEDVFAPVGVLRRLVLRARETMGVAVAAMPLRDGTGRMNVQHTENLTTVDSASSWYPMKVGGLALAATHRNAVLHLGGLVKWFDVGGRSCPALFLDGICEREWQSEDVFFCELARLHSVPLEFMVSPDVVHDGVAADVEPNAESLS